MNAQQLSFYLCCKTLNICLVFAVQTYKLIFFNGVAKTCKITSKLNKLWILLNKQYKRKVCRNLTKISEFQNRLATKYDLHISIHQSQVKKQDKGAFTNYLCIQEWHFLTTYVSSLHFLCSKLNVFLTTYPPLASVICESSLTHNMGAISQEPGEN